MSKLVPSKLSTANDKTSAPASRVFTRTSTTTLTQAPPSTVKKQKPPLVAATPKVDSAILQSSTSQLNKSRPRLATVATSSIPSSTTLAPSTSISKSISSSTVGTSSLSSAYKPINTNIPTAPISSVRSYSELVKSEEALLQQLSKFESEVNELKGELAAKEAQLSALRTAYETAEERTKQLEIDWQHRLDSATRSESERFQRLAVDYSNLQEKVELLEKKLEEVGINPETLERISLTDEELSELRREEELFQKELSELPTKAKERQELLGSIAQELSQLVEKVSQLSSPGDLPDFVLEALAFTNTSSPYYDENIPPTV